MWTNKQKKILNMHVQSVKLYTVIYVKNEWQIEIPVLPRSQQNSFLCKTYFFKLWLKKAFLNVESELP